MNFAAQLTRLLKGPWLWFCLVASIATIAWLSFRLPNQDLRFAAKLGVVVFWGLLAAFGQWIWSRTHKRNSEKEDA